MRLALLACLLAFAIPVLEAQSTVTVSVRTDPAGATIMVDDIPVRGEQTFVWASGTTHTLTAPTSQVLPNVFPAREYLFSHWSDSLRTVINSAPVLTFTASSVVTAITAHFVPVSSTVKLTYHPCNSPAPSPGSVSINGSVYTCDTELRMEIGSEVAVSAAANPGWVFSTWGNGGPVGGRTPEQSFTLGSPVLLTPRFDPARVVTLDASPSGLLVSPDQGAVITPADMLWGAGSSHNLAPVSPQRDSLKRLWVFDSWSSGAEASHVYEVTQEARQRVTAVYVPGVEMSLVPQPGDLRLEVDGSTEWAGYNFVWGVGHTHTVTAPAVQVDRTGRPWVFKGWSNGGDRSQTIQVTAAHQGQRLVATYEPASVLRIETTPPGIPLTVDGETCVTPCLVGRAPGDTAAIVAPRGHFLSEMVRLDFTGWEDGAAGRARDWTFTNAQATLRASYRTLYRLDVAVDPPGSANLRMEPASADRFYGWYDNVKVYVEPVQGYEFFRWRGDFSGRFHPAQVTLSEPRSLVAELAREGDGPAVQVSSATGLTPEGVVAPGSVFSLWGDNLAPQLEAAPEGTLAAQLGGVTVEWAAQPLGLFFASPGQINAQLPADMPPGEHWLEVKSESGFTGARIVGARHAPGLFTWVSGDRTLLVALDAEGALVTPEHPAAVGETVTLLGTGFGILSEAERDGAAPPPGYLDPVEVWAGDTWVQPLALAPVPGYPGLDALKVRVPVLADPSTPWRVRVAGRPSNAAVLAMPSAELSPGAP